MAASDDTVEKIISAQKLKSLALMKYQTSNKVSSLTGDLGDEIAKAVEKGLNARAFSIASSLYKALKKDSIKGGTLLRDVQLYIDQMDLESMVADELPLEDKADAPPVKAAKSAKGKGGKGAKKTKGKNGAAKNGAGPAETTREAAKQSDAAVEELKRKFSTGEAAAADGNKAH